MRCLIIEDVGYPVLERRLDLLVRHIDELREAVRVTKRDRPFYIDAWVVLPDHKGLPKGQTYRIQI
jgi:hypothetical protein